MRYSSREPLQNSATLHVLNSSSLQTTYALWTVLAPRLALRTGSPSLRVPAIEFAILVVPLLLALTALSAYPLALNVILLGLVLVTDRLDLPLASPPLSPKQTRRSADPLPLANRLFSQPFVTVYRAHMMLMTVICILAVDFKIFPREFAKAETWGTSLVSPRIRLLLVRTR